MYVCLMNEKKALFLRGADDLEAEKCEHKRSD